MKTSQGNKDKKEKVFSKYMQEKLAITVLVTTLALFVLVINLYRIVKNNNEEYSRIVLTQHATFNSKVLPFRRGSIVDRNGTYLATTEKVYNLILDPKVILKGKEDEQIYLDPTLEALTSCFGYDKTELLNLIQERSESNYYRHERRLPEADKQRFEEIKAEINKRNKDSDSPLQVNGVWFEEDYKRIYPQKTLASHVVGFANSDGLDGTGGIEQFYNNYLIGSNGREYGYLNDESNMEQVIKPAVNGYTLVSTIDANIQTIVEKHINKWKQETGSKHIGVVVMDPNNGEVLAMASENQFDLNNPRDLNGYYTELEIRAFGIKEAMEIKRREGNTITEEQAMEQYTAEEIKSLGSQVAWNQVWRNYCISDTFEPGSPSKIFTVATGLEEGVIRPENYFFCDGIQHVGGHDIKCTAYLKGGHGNISVAEALMVSCNDAMMQMAAIEGKQKFTSYLADFGFGKKTGIDLPGEADTSTLVYNADNIGASDLATNSFGQNYNCTMIQMAAAYCSAINGGSYYEPHVVKQIINEQGSVVKQIEPTVLRETVSQSTSDFIKQALFRTVEEGTGKYAAVEGYEVAGKTGTAEKHPRKKGNYVVSFAGFAPANDPQVLIYVVIDEPNVADQASSRYASIVFSEILADTLPYMNVFPTRTITAPIDETEAPAGDEANDGETQIQEEAEAAEENRKPYPTEEIGIENLDESGTTFPSE